MVFGCIVALVFFQTLANGQCSIDDAVRIALRCHPQLNVAKSEIAIAQARLIDAGKLENPVLEFSTESQITDGPDREGSLFIGYSQVFPVTAKLLRERDLGVADVRLACAEVMEVERQLIADVQSAYITAVGARATIDAANELEEDARAYITLARNQLQLAQGSELDVASAETEKVLALQDRVRAEGDFKRALATLRPFLGIPANQPVHLTQNLDGVIATLRTSVRFDSPASISRSDITAAEMRKERACIDEKLARAQTREDWEIAAGYQTGRSLDEPEGIERERFLGMGVKIPLAVRKKGAGRIAEARAEIEKACHEVDLLKINSLGEVGLAIAEVNAAERRYATLNDNVLPQLKDREAKTRSAYEQGLTAFTQVILLRQQQARTRIALTEARLEKALAMGRLQHALGSNPHLHRFDPETCKPYKCSTEPKNAPWALPVMSQAIEAQTIQAKPVAEARKLQPPSESAKAKRPRVGWFKKRSSNASQ